MQNEGLESIKETITSIASSTNGAAAHFRIRTWIRIRICNRIGSQVSGLRCRVTNVGCRVSAVSAKRCLICPLENPHPFLILKR